MNLTKTRIYALNVIVKTNEIQIVMKKCVLFLLVLLAFSLNAQQAKQVYITSFLCSLVAMVFSESFFD